MPPTQTDILVFEVIKIILKIAPNPLQWYTADLMLSNVNMDNIYPLGASMLKKIEMFSFIMWQGQPQTRTEHDQTNQTWSLKQNTLASFIWKLLRYNVEVCPHTFLCLSVYVELTVFSSTGHRGGARSADGYMAWHPHFVLHNMWGFGLRVCTRMHQPCFYVCRRAFPCWYHDAWEGERVQKHIHLLQVIQSHGFSHVLNFNRLQYQTCVEYWTL